MNFENITKMVFSVVALVVFALFMVGAFFKRRFFCFFCPMAAMLSLFDKFGLLKLKKRGQRCTRCNNCTKTCPTDITEIAQNRTKCNMTTQDCIMCMKCVEECPEDNALRITFCGITIFKSTAKGFLKRQLKKSKKRGNI